VSTVAHRPLVVLVDDEPAIRETVSFILDMEGFEVATAEDGERGLELVRRLRPPVVLLDVMLPRLDGFSVCRAIRGDPALSGVRVVMLTAMGQRSDRLRAREVGADHFVTKPFDEEELVAILRSLTGAA
jgi:DNA-binding response OmpR family regulator